LNKGGDILIERSVVNLKSDSFNNVKSKKPRDVKDSNEKNSFEKTLDEENKTLERKNFKVEKDTETNKTEENKKTEENSEKDNKEENKSEETIQVVSFLNLQELSKFSKINNTKAGNLENIEGLKLEESTKQDPKQGSKPVELKTNLGQPVKEGQNQEVSVKEILGDENLNLKDQEKSKLEISDDEEIKLEEIKNLKKISEEEKLTSLKTETSKGNDLNQELKKKLESLKESISSIDEGKEDKEVDFNENLKKSLEGSKDNFKDANIRGNAEVEGKSEKFNAGKDSIIDQMAKSITTGKEEKGNFIKVQLKPEVLGEMTVKLTEGKEGMIATISAEKEVVKNILRNSGEQITAVLGEKNIKVSSVVIETNESEKQDFNLFSDNPQEDFTGERGKEENFSQNRFSQFTGNRESIGNIERKADEIYTGKGINFYV
jgi:flagellar hook-length control protein FliK